MIYCSLLGSGELDRLDLSNLQTGWTQLAVTTPPMAAIAIRGSDVYFGYGNLIGRVNTDGTGLRRALARLGPNATIAALATTARYLYWGEHSSHDTIARSDLHGKHVNHHFVSGLNGIPGVGIG